MKTFSQRYIILALLVVLFAAPGLSAYFFYHNPNWLSAPKTNRGQLLTPPIAMKALAGANNKWRLLFWSPESCGADCLGQMEKIAKIRLALGRRLYDVDCLLLLGPHALQSPKSLVATLANQDIQVKKLTANEYQASQLPEKPVIYIENPTGYLVLAYTLDEKSEAIHKDLKHLLVNQE